MRTGFGFGKISAIVAMLFMLGSPGCGCWGGDGPCDFNDRKLQERGEPLEFTTVLSTSSAELVADGKGGTTYPVALGYRVINTQAALDEYWNFKIFSGQTKPQVDFTRQTLVVVASYATDRNALAVTRVSTDQVIWTDQFYCSYANRPPIVTSIVLVVAQGILSESTHHWGARNLPCRDL